MAGASGPLVLAADAGATRVRAARVALAAAGPRLAGAVAAAPYPPAPGWAPVPLGRQLAQGEAPRLERAERERGDAVVEAVAAVLAEAARGGEVAPVAGVAFPGRFTPDGRGVAVLRHGPRIPDLASALEGALARRQLTLAVTLLPDARAAALGEEAARGGPIAPGTYYLLPGTGLAEIFFLATGPAGPRELGLPAAWELEAPEGGNYEDRLSLRGLNARFAAAGGRGYPEAAAAREDPAAAAVLGEAGRLLVALAQARARAGFPLRALLLAAPYRPFAAVPAFREALRRAPVPVRFSSLPHPALFGAALAAARSWKGNG